MTACPPTQPPTHPPAGLPVLLLCLLCLQQMNQELRYQESHAERIRGDTDTLGYKLQSVNREGFKRI